MPASPASNRLDLVRERADTRRAPVPLPDAIALAGVGLEPLCEVIGAISILDSRGGFYAAGRIVGDPSRPVTYTTSPPSKRVGMPATLRTIKTGFARAYDRLLDEARAVRADGVLGITVHTARVETAMSGSVNRAYDVVLQGTAVRATGHRHPEKPFTTSMSGTQVAAALRGGLVPVAYLQASVMGVRFIDPLEARTLGRLAPNAESAGLSELMTVCRARARQDFHDAARRAGGDTAVVDAVAAELHGEGHATGDRTALAVVTGTALASFDPPRAPRPPLTVLPLGSLADGSPAGGTPSRGRRRRR